MPNHVTNIMTIHGDRAEEIYERINGKWDDGSERIFDFNVIIPMPAELMIESTGETFDAEALFKEGKEPTEKHSPNIHKYYANLKKYGVSCWYRWCIDNWGTKWNAYSAARRDERTIKFETAWSCPIPVLKRLSKDYPDIVFEVKYADEDIGYNCGHFELRDGEIIDKRPELDMGTSESEAFAYEVTGRVPYRDEDEL